ncbi:MAG TPA: hypothetical protein PLW18_02690 [Candidatus Dojkabacteria bacterium]|nr:hypothetical protein [Candidatus Dojkabacteria bacterium]
MLSPLILINQELAKLQQLRDTVQTYSNVYMQQNIHQVGELKQYAELAKEIDKMKKGY